MDGRRWSGVRAGADRALTLVELTMVMGVAAIILALVVPVYLRSRLAANEVSCVASLREVLRTETIWQQNDHDRNGVADYWTGDLSGMYRVERPVPLPSREEDPTGEQRRASRAYVECLSETLAAADEAPVGGGEFIEGAVLPGGALRAAAVLTHKRSEPKSGYWLASLDLDYGSYPEGPFAADPDGNGQFWSSTSRFAFRGRPAAYRRTGVNFFILNHAGVVYVQDFGSDRGTFARNWPGSMELQAGWKEEGAQAGK